jgi:hypothetical protein
MHSAVSHSCVFLCSPAEFRCECLNVGLQLLKLPRDCYVIPGTTGQQFEGDWKQAHVSKLYK